MTRIAITGSGQAVSHWTPSDTAHAPSPTTLRHAAASKAMSGRKHVDVLVVLRTTEDSIPTSTHPHGRDANPPRTLARDLGITAGERIYHHSGGQSPQEVINRLASRMAEEEFRSALIVSAEATGAAKAATRAGMTLDWSEDADGDFTDRGMGLGWLDPNELRHGLITPASYYGLMETALAREHGRSRSEHRREMAALFAPFSDVAAANAYAQFPTQRSEDFLAAPSPENFPVTDPYLKWHVAQDAVNQAAAIHLEAVTDDPPDAVYLRAGSDAADCALTHRAELHCSRAMDAAIPDALARAGWQASDLSALDLYSCFPVAVWSALTRLQGLPEMPLTLTGGLPFFGGPGNSYSLHAIAEMHATLANTQARGLVLANGGWMSKESVGLYSGTATEFVGTSKATLPPQVDICAQECTGKIETYTLGHGRSGPHSGTATLRLADGRRALAVIPRDLLARFDSDTLLTSHPARVTQRGGIGQLGL